MAKITIITDKSGKLLGAVRSDPIKVGDRTLQFHRHPLGNHLYHEIEVEDALLRGPVERFCEELERRAPKR